MSTLSPDQTTDKPAHGDVGTRGTALYDLSLRGVLEPGSNGQFVAINPDTGDYAVASTSGDALRALYARHPDCSLMVRRIGSEPQHGLAARLLAGDAHARQTQ